MNPEADAVDDDTLRRLRTVLAEVGELVGATRLTGGFFATTYRAELADGRAVVVKTAPADESRLLTYEADLVRAEALVYGLGTDRPDLLMPRLLATDFSRSAFAGDVAVASWLPGVPWDRAGFGSVVDDPRAARAQRELGALMARFHGVTGPRFGYLVDASGLVGDTWPQAFGRMVEALLRDAERWDVDVPVRQVLAAVAAHQDALAQVTTPVLVHHDLWPGNLFVDPGTGELVGVIDPERGLWGDPLLDLLGADQSGRDLLPAGLLAGYAEQAGAPLDVTSPGAVARLGLYRVLWSLIWIVEATPRSYDAEFATWYVGTARTNLSAALAGLGVTG
ncbi:phosphotransferase family protein [Cellulomonas palmilytica]|uniref:phosphotransferase family protein n=1 Tax=Cellulomonas palmilytica TaxID=2608402 RepID=UPI001F46A1B5|nr:aminoglycoside phosphotransferase family protein [Cellulomonas palmilytica]UJP40322.1 aminoglycoside phosphotransferase family protein [Cellulomonas palmilytica]